MGKHQFGEVIPTVPKTRKCSRCGGHVVAEDVSDPDEPWLINQLKAPGLLPTDMKMAERKCQKPKYTEYELDEARREAIEYGRHKGIGLRPEFEKKLLSKFRFNESTQVFELPIEQFELLKEEL